MARGFWGWWLGLTSTTSNTEANQADQVINGGTDSAGLYERTDVAIDPHGLNPLNEVPAGNDDTFLETTLDDLGEGLTDLVVDPLDKMADIMVTELGEWWQGTVAPWLGDKTNSAYNHLIHFLGTIMFGLSSLVDRSFRKNYGVGDIVRTPTIPNWQIASYDLPDVDNFSVNILPAERIGPWSIPGSELFSCVVHNGRGLFGMDPLPKCFDLQKERYWITGPETIQVGTHWLSNIDGDWNNTQGQQAYQGYGGVTPPNTDLNVSPFVEAVWPGVGNYEVRYKMAQWDSHRDDRLLFESMPHGYDSWNLERSVFY